MCLNPNGREERRREEWKNFKQGWADGKNFKQGWFYRKKVYDMQHCICCGEEKENVFNANLSLVQLSTASTNGKADPSNTQEDVNFIGTL